MNVEMNVEIISGRVFCFMNGGQRGRDRREGYREMDRGRRDKFSPIRHDGSPPQMKRMRRDW